MLLPELGTGCASAGQCAREMWGKANSHITPPATVAALVEALEECAEDLHNEIIARGAGERRQKRDLEPVMRAHAALALYREAGR